jgi:3-oxoacyl-[acyl-carrier protein] reductase
VVARFHGLDILVNNAGYTWDAVIHKMTDDQWEQILEVHLTAPFRLIRGASAYLRETAKREQGEHGQVHARKIINVSSISGTRGNPGQANYASAKTGLIGLTKTLAKEWGPFNIQANAVAFGRINTRLTQPKERGETIHHRAGNISIGIPSKQIKMTTRSNPMGRPGTPLEGAGAILFFASSLSNYVSGQILEVTGGL